ncbi:phage tail protein [Dielma fastidiosa]|uniref:phage tail protein n=1 Tax=Dielma fastidiosa TaxID=1034346 RepID=UPI0023F4AD1D|nr:hypothetical protein [Dielma fastidiosa]
MAENENIYGIRYEVDIEQLKSSTSEAARQIKLANAQFKEASSGMEDWANTSEGLAAKLTQLNTVLEAEKSKLQNLKKSHNDHADTLNKQATTITELRNKRKQLVDEYGAESNEVKDLDKELSKLERTQLQNKKAAENLQIAIAEQQAKVNNTERSLKDYKKQLNEVEQAQGNAEKSGKSFEDELKELRNTADETGTSVIDLSGGFTVMKGVLANLVADGIRKAADALKDFAVNMIDTAASVKAETSQFEQTFGDMADEAEAAISRVASASGILDTRLKTTGAQIYAFARSNGASVSEAMSLMETALNATADSAAYYDKSLESSADTMMSFLKGNFANDAALGVSATEFTRNAKAVELFGTEYNNLSEIQKQQTLLKMVTDSQELSGAMGQAAREADGWENVQGNLNETWRQFQAQVGSPFLEALIPIVQAVTSSFKDWQEGIDWTQFGNTVKGIADNIIAGFGWVADHGNEIVSIVGGMVTAWASYKAIMAGIWAVGKIKAFVTAITGAKTVTAAFKAGMAALNITMTANPVGLIVAAIAGLIAAFVLAYNKVEWFRDGVDKAFAWLKEFVGTAINNIALFFTDTLPHAIDKTVQWFRDLPNNISTYLTTALDNVKTWVSNMVNSAVEMGGNFIASVVQFFNELPYNIGYYTGLAIGSVIQWALDMVDQAKVMGTNFIASVVEFFTRLPGKAAEFLTSTYKKAVQWRTDMVNKAIDLGKNFIKGVIDYIQQLPSKIAEFTSKVITDIIEWAKNLVDKATQTGKDTYDGLVDEVKKIPGKVLEIGADIVKGLWNGISSMGSWLWDKVTGWADGILQGMKDAFDINSPSKETAWLGKMLGLGLGDGLTGTASDLVSKAKGVASQVMGAMQDGLKGKLTIDPQLVSNIRSKAAGVLHGLTASVPALAGAGGTVQNYTFNQYNTDSPQSRWDIFRQTKNLLSQTKKRR